jgi:GT2 family glycosyltransferase
VTTHRQAPDGATVTALLVSHDGARWLPAVLDGLAAQTRRPDRVVAVDTGSSDASVQLLRDRIGAESVLTAPATSSYGAAVGAGLAAGAPTEWVWLLHDDSAPAPEALERLLAAAEAQPSASVLGPKLREWPSLRRLLEVGVTISGTGRRETGLERGEYDQGQHDRVRDVLAVNTAGMLVRRSVLDSLGFDERLPLFGTDLDFGWRAARAGHRTVVVPDAVLFHGEAAHRGSRRTGLTGSHRRGERSAALYTLLANCSAVALPFVLVRLFAGSLLRAVGFLLVRAPRESADELTALLSTYARPQRILSARRIRRRSATVPARDVRHLLAPPWMPYRHGLDVVGEAAGALAGRAGDLSQARQARVAAPHEGTETGPVPTEAQNLPADTGLVARSLTSPVAWVFAILVVASLVGARGLVGGGLLSGGALLPAPDSATDWWRTYLASHHDVGIGSAAPAAPYLPPLAVLGSVLLGKAWLVVDLLFLLAVPLAAMGAYRFLLRVTSSVPASLWGAATYGVLPVVTGAVQQGRLGTVAGTLLLPWLAHSAVFLAATGSADRRTRAAWRTSLWLALLVAFVPVAWVLAAGVAAVAVVASRRRSALLVVVPLLVAPVLLLPWSWSTWSFRGPVSWLFEAGLPVPTLTDPLGRWEMLLARPGAGAPAWISAGVVLAALAALLRPDTRAAVLRAWTVLAVALVVSALLAARTYAPTDGGVEQPLWLGFPLVVAQGAAICAAALAGTGIRRRLSGSSFGWQQPVGVLVVAVAVLTPVVSTVWWLLSGSDEPLDRTPPTTAPTYMTEAADSDPVNGVLVVRGSRARGFDYVVLRGAGTRLGEDSVRPDSDAQARLTRRVQNLVTSPQPADVAALSRRGVAYVYAPAPADPSLVGNLDGLSGVAPGSAAQPGARAWQLEARPTAAGLSRDADPLRPWLLAVQGIAIVVVVVLAAPSRRGRR